MSRSLNKRKCSFPSPNSKSPDQILKMDKYYASAEAIYDLIEIWNLKNRIAFLCVQVFSQSDFHQHLSCSSKHCFSLQVFCKYCIVSWRAKSWIGDLVMNFILVHVVLLNLRSTTWEEMKQLKNTAIDTWKKQSRNSFTLYYLWMRRVVQSTECHVFRLHSELWNGF